jgi:2-keto-4-pentenoate hydratase/2-oxohepta-3-ene-1,7-dioic acid hydratase in catechol pathway
LKIVSFSPAADGEPRLGALLDGGAVLDFCHEACGVPQPRTHVGWFDLDGAPLAEALALFASLGERLEGLRAAGAVCSASELNLLAPVPRPGKVMCIGLNYYAHAAEQDEEVPERPLLFSKFPTAVTGPGAVVRRPQGSEKLDYEAELVAVIGRRCSRVRATDAASYVLGYCCGNDVSARDFQFADGQWQRGKSCDTLAPMGPHLVTADELGDPDGRRIQMRLNGDAMQDASTGHMMYKVPQLLEALSEGITLEPGDVIYTGTPPGVGFARKPPVWVQPGDVLEVEIEGLGVLRNPVEG